MRHDLVQRVGNTLLTVGFTILLLITIVGLVLLLVLVGKSNAQSSETRIDTFDTKSRRTGSAIVNESSGRVDFYDRKSNRTGYGTIDKGGRIDLYDRKSNRAGSGQTKGRR